MPIPTDLEHLTELFARLGAENPGSWASSQVNEGIEQLHRFLFLRQAWSKVISDGDTTWITHQIERAKANPSEPYAGVGLALARCLEKGADPRDLSDIARGMQATMLFRVCYLLEDPDLSERELESVGWCLVATNENLEPTKRLIDGLHESVLETDPTGRWMRARDA
jgi:hypothetical protein